MPPIRPENAHHYDAVFRARALAVKEAAGWRCVCAGECGSAACAPRCTNVHGQPMRNRKVAVMTAAHLDHDPWNPEARLACFCAPCHLRYDAEEHQRVKRAKRAAAADAMLWLLLLRA